MFRYDVEAWDEKDGIIPRLEMMKRIRGKNALFVCIDETIDRDILIAAGQQILILHFA